MRKIESLNSYCGSILDQGTELCKDLCLYVCGEFEGLLKTKICFLAVETFDVLRNLFKN